MNSLNNIKMQVSNIFAFSLVLGLMVGCASVTDANIDTPVSEQITPATTDTQAEANDIWFNSNGDDMDPIIDKPKTGGTYYD